MTIKVLIFDIDLTICNNSQRKRLALERALSCKISNQDWKQIKSEYYLDKILSKLKIQYTELILQKFLSHFLYDEDYEKNGIEFLDLTDQDLVNAFKERYQRIEGTWMETKEDIERQKEYWKIFKSWNQFPIYHNWIHPQHRVGSDWLMQKGSEFLQ